MLAQRLLRLSRPPLFLPCRALHWRISRRPHPAPKRSPAPHIRVRQARAYSEEARARLEADGVPLGNSGPTTAVLLAYAESNWPPPSVVPAGWSTDWRRFPYLLTLFAYSPYFLRLPQIEMLVTIKHAVPGEARPLMYHPTRDLLVFAIDKPELADGPEGAAQLLLLDCKAFEVWTYDEDAGEDAPDTVDELCLLIGAAPSPEGVPMVRLEPDPDGVAALQRILDRDLTVIPLLTSEFLGYEPTPTERAEELVTADQEESAAREKTRTAIREAREHVKQAQEELRLDRLNLEELRTAAEAPEIEGLETNEEVRAELRAAVQKDAEAHAQMREAVEEAEDRVVEWERVWTERYGPLDLDEPAV
ncbi:hypothetical protein C8R44DRAFT_808334 [Mycena epipterygia]|nr:hypothetical protein C8R44DRAFT_808334 [Mycena epipterygia]